MPIAHWISRRCLITGGNLEFSVSRALSFLLSVCLKTGRSLSLARRGRPARAYGTINSAWPPAGAEGRARPPRPKNVGLEQSLRRQVRSYGRVTGVMAASGRLTGQASKRGQQRGHVTWEDM